MMTKEERVAKAVSLFKEGYNCAQSVVGAYADLYGFTPEQAFRMSASFGAGIGRMRLTCGAACGMFLLAGLERSAVVGADRASKSANYALVQELAAKFKEQANMPHYVIDNDDSEAPVKTVRQTDTHFGKFKLFAKTAALPFIKLAKKTQFNWLPCKRGPNAFEVA